MSTFLLGLYKLKLDQGSNLNLDVNFLEFVTFLILKKQPQHRIRTRIVLHESLRRDQRPAARKLTMGKL